MFRDGMCMIGKAADSTGPMEPAPSAFPGTLHKEKDYVN